MYCFKCKNLTKTCDYGERVSKDGKLMEYGWCSFCGSKKTTFNKRGSGIVNSLINNLLVNLHYPIHNFLGPGTKLNKRLNNDTTF